MGIAFAIAAATTLAAGAPAQAAVGTKSSNGSAVIAEKRLDAQTLDITVRSKGVGQDLTARVLLPKGWTAGNDKKYPVLELLQGGQDNYTSWTRMTDVEQLVASKNVMVVMPEAGPAATYTNYYNGGKYGTPAWETWHTKEILEILQNGYNAGTTRAIAGVSSGGYGAAIYAAHNVGAYQYVSSYSGTTSIQDPANQWIITLITGEFNFNRWGVPGINQDIWKANDPVEQAAKLKGLKGIYVSSGMTGLNQDGLDNTIWSPVQVVEIITGNMNTTFAAKLKAVGAPVQTHFYTYGQHSWPSWQCEFHDNLPTILTSIGANTGTAKWYPEIAACQGRDRK